MQGSSGRLSPRDPAVVLLGLGVALRLAVFVFLPPRNNDSAGHLEYISYIVENHAIPLASYGNETYQPPLYYMLAAPLWAVFRDEKIIQCWSLILSLSTLWLYYRLLVGSSLIPSRTGQLCALGCLSVLPQFVLFGLYVSNDALAIFGGALIILALWHLVVRPGATNCAVLAVVLGLGLLTKAVFLPYIPIIASAFVLVQARAFGAKAAVPATIGFLALALGIGSYKYVESAIRLGNPWVSNLDPGAPWVQAQHGILRGITSLIDVDLVRLIKSPTVSSETARSLPLMLYGTFWYPHIPESGFILNTFSPTKYLGSLIYIGAIVPTLTAFAGAVCFARSLWLSGAGTDWQRNLVRCTAVALFGAAVVQLAVVALVQDVWSVLQARLLFPSIFGGVVLFGYGMAAIQKHALVRNAVYSCIAILPVLFGVYYVSEIGHYVIRWVDPLLLERIKGVLVRG